MRLDKFLCEMNIGSRRQVKDLIKQGLVSVAAQTVCSPERQIDPAHDEITCRGRLLIYEKYVYFMLNKPAGTVSATSDRFDKTVVDILREDWAAAAGTAGQLYAGRDIFPVGRLDKDTEGLLLLTDDGALAHELLSPRQNVRKVYYVRTNKPLSAPDIQTLTDGVDIGDGKKTRPAEVKLLAPDEMWLTITEGRFHQVKRMLEAIGHRVVYLKRLAMGGLWLDDNLAPGQFRPLNQEERRSLTNVKRN